MTAAVQKKLWGETRPVYSGDSHSLYHATPKAGGYSSRHYHATKHNLFYIVSGTLLVHFYADRDGPVTRTVSLTRGDFAMSEAGEWHRFEAVTDCELIELYTSYCIDDDIVRADEGGLKSHEADS